MQSETAHFKARHSLHSPLEKQFAGPSDLLVQRQWSRVAMVGCSCEDVQ